MEGKRSKERIRNKVRKEEWNIRNNKKLTNK
jgi:hypothetical protein